MEESDYATLLELKKSIAENLEELEKNLIDYSVHSNDEDFEAMIRKAINYREIIKRIDEQLNS